MIRNIFAALPSLRDDQPTKTEVPKSLRFGTVVVVAVLAATATHFMPHSITLRGQPVGDIGPPLVSLGLLASGQNPYDITLAGGNLAQYPVTTMLVVAPLKPLPPQYWAPVFAAITSGLLGWALLSKGQWWRMLMLVSPPYIMALHSVQWSPVFAAALLLPALLPVAVAKPQLAIALLAAGRWNRTALVGTAAIVILSFGIRPTWAWEWLSSGLFGLYDSSIPAFVGPGFLLVVSLIFLRSRRGRLLAAMSFIPQRFFYDPLLIFLIPRSWRQMVVLCVSSWTGVIWAFQRGLWEPASGSQTPEVWIIVISTIYLPALLMLCVDWRTDRNHPTAPTQPKHAEPSPPHKKRDRDCGTKINEFLDQNLGE